MRLDGSRIHTWDDFYEDFATQLGFIEGYGRNMNAWMDCMSCLADAESAMTQVTLRPGEALVIQVDNAADLKTRLPLLLETLLECAAIVNQNLIREAPILMVAFAV
jgi:Barstar (barnase inhibitor)